MATRINFLFRRCAPTYVLPRVLYNKETWMIYLSRFVIGGVLTLLPFVTIAAASPAYIETATTTLAAGRMQQDNLTDHKHLTICPLNRYQAAT